MGLFNKKSNKEEKDDKKETTSEAMTDGHPVEAGEGIAVLPKGKSANAYFSIINPVVTEKSTMLNQSNQYVFKISKPSNKNQVKKAIEDLYGVKVEKVRIINLPSKTRHIGRQIGIKSGFKKALVKLKSGDSIQLT